MTLYRYIGRRPETLGSGRPVATSDVVEADLAHHHDRWLIAVGLLVPIPDRYETKLTGDALKQRAADLNIEGRSSMGADELRAAVAAAENGGQQA